MKLLEDGSYRWKVGINVAIIILSLYTVSKENPKLERLSPFDQFMIDVLAPMQRGVTSVKSGVGAFFNNYVANVNASKHNEELNKEIADLKSSIFQFQELEKENVRLKRLLQFGQDIARKKVLAQIVSWDASSDFKVLRINKGIKDGIRLQSTVVTAEGLVGYIYRLTEHFADILTILDANNRIDGIIERTRSHGIVEGYSKERCIMKYVTRTEPVVLNDMVLTSGLGNVYPKGIRVGHITRIERESYGITQHIEIAPVVDFSRLEEVVVLVAPEDQKKKLEWEALDGPAKKGRRK